LRRPPTWAEAVAGIISEKTINRIIPLVFMSVWFKVEMLKIMNFILTVAKAIPKNNPFLQKREERIIMII